MKTLVTPKNVFAFGFLLIFLSACATEVTRIEKMNSCDKARENLRQGMAYSGNRNYGNAETEFKKAIELCPKLAEAHANLGVTYIATHQLNKAARSLNQAISLDPQNAYAYYNLAAVYSLQKKLDLALESLGKSLDRDFNNIDALRNDPDLKNLRREPGFTHLLETHRIFLK